MKRSGESYLFDIIIWDASPLRIRGGQQTRKFSSSSELIQGSVNEKCCNNQDEILVTEDDEKRLNIFFVW